MEGFIRFFPNKIRSPPNPHLEYFFSISLLHCAVCHHFGGSCICICLCLSYLQQLSPKLHSFCFILTKLCIEIHATFHLAIFATFPLLLFTLDSLGTHLVDFDSLGALVNEKFQSCFLDAFLSIFSISL